MEQEYIKAEIYTVHLSKNKATFLCNEDAKFFAGTYYILTEKQLTDLKESK